MAKCLMYVDLLGVKSLMRSGGVAAIDKRLDVFHRQFAAAIAPTDAVAAACHSDSGIALFADPVAAVLAGEAVFKATFDHGGPPLWLRGVIVGAPAISSLDDLTVKRTIKGLPTSTHSEPLLTAIVAENSGFKGMRLLIPRTLLTRSDRTALRREVIVEDPHDAVATPTANVYLTRTLKYASSDASLADVLWMVDDEPEFNDRDELLSNRLRRSGGNAAESQQAAMTKVVSEEVRAIVGYPRR